MRRILPREFDIALAQQRRLVWRHQSDRFRKCAHSSRPTIEHAKLHSCHGHLRHLNKADDADENEISGDLLSDFFAEQRALQVRQDSGWLHKIFSNAVTDVHNELAW